jgi:peptidoglycan hydrolase CwlO-like protein
MKTWISELVMVLALSLVIVTFGASPNIAPPPPAVQLAPDAQTQIKTLQIQVAQLQAQVKDLQAVVNAQPRSLDWLQKSCNASIPWWYLKLRVNNNDANSVTVCGHY